MNKIVPRRIIIRLWDDIDVYDNYRKMKLFFSIALCKFSIYQLLSDICLYFSVITLNGSIYLLVMNMLQHSKKCTKRGVPASKQKKKCKSQQYPQENVETKQRQKLRNITQQHICGLKEEQSYKYLVWQKLILTKRWNHDYAICLMGIPFDCCLYM